MTDQSPLDKEIISLYHISRVALSNSDCSRHSRLCYIKSELTKRYSHLLNGLHGKKLWFHILNVLS